MRARPGGHRGLPPAPARQLRQRHPDTLQRRFLDTPGQIINTGDTITVKLNRRAYSPVLRSADLPADTTVPWWGDRRLRFDFA